MYKSESITATNRFGLGARPGEAANAERDPRGWLKSQLDESAQTGPDDPGLRSAEAALGDFFVYREQRAEMQRSGQAADTPDDGERAKPPDEDSPRAEIAREIEARTRFAIRTEQSFRERLVRFWSNHFTVSVTKPPVVSVAGAFEREAIRPHVTGSFYEMLLASETHQAMLIYLDNATSVGPNSLAGRRRGRGLNENLAREILELHTVGVDGGYDQADVVEFARALTGWTVSGPRDREPDGQTWFDSRCHEPGKRTVMGRTYPDSDAQQAPAILHDLAHHPQTARFVSTKLARHFIADNPPDAAIAALEKTFLDSGGDLREVSTRLVDLDEAWSPDLEKFKTPDEFHISTLRGLGTTTVRRNSIRATYGALGQAPFSASSPAGWPDEADSWLGPDAIEKRFEWSSAVAGRLRGRTDPREFLAETLGETASNRTRLMINGADSREQGMTLALMAPEFQRR